MSNQLKKVVERNLEAGNYREAAEKILERMKNLSENANDRETVKDIEDVLSKIFNLPNIDWQKAESEQAWLIKK